MSSENTNDEPENIDFQTARMRLRRFDNLASGQTRDPVGDADDLHNAVQRAGTVARVFITAIGEKDDRKDVADLLPVEELRESSDGVSSDRESPDRRRARSSGPIPVRDNIRAVALLTHRELLEATNEGWKLTTRPFHEVQELCAGERFFDHPVSTPATAFLVREDLVVTLRHNLDLFPSLDTIRVIFDFALQTSGAPQSCKRDFSRSEVFEVTDRYSLVDDSRNAFVALRLSRPVTDRRPVVCNFGTPIGPREKVFMIGHPCGLPKIYADNAIVLDASSAEGFTASLDAFSGNSGSPVFNAETGQVEGILAEGGDDFRWREDGPGRFCNYAIVHEAPALFDYKVLRIQPLQRLLGP